MAKSAPKAEIKTPFKDALKTKVGK